jgi:hypothetical protein
MSESTTERRVEARQALEQVICEYADVFGPSEESIDTHEHPVIGAWVIVTHWSDMGAPTGWTTAERSGCSYPMQLGLMTEVLHGWEHMRDDDG